jgi:uncharacterized protein (TIGR03437 family)
MPMSSCLRPIRRLLHATSAATAARVFGSLRLAVLGIAAALGAAPAHAQTAVFNFFATPTFVADRGDSEVIGEIILSADAVCGTNVDTFCISAAGSIQATYTNLTIDNTTASGITVCEVIAAVTTCNGPGTYLTGAIQISATAQGGVVSIGVKAGANFAAGDQVRISGVRAIVSQSSLATPGTGSTAILTAAPVIVAGFSPTANVIARSADAWSLGVLAAPLVPCVASDPAAILQISEQFTTAFVDQGDSAESTYVGQPAHPRPLFGATNSTRIRLVLAGLVDGLTVNWPAHVPAVSGNAVLDRVSQAPDGSVAIYVFSTPDQGASDNMIETFDLMLTSANFTFSGNGFITGDVTVQGQLYPPADSTTARPRYNDPLQPVPGADFLALLRCNTTTGTLTVRANVDGIGWNGALNFTLTGPTPFTGTTVPAIVQGLVAGTYTLDRISGGPNGATFAGYDPAQAVAVTVDGTSVINIKFVGPTIADLQLTPSAVSVCPAPSTTVGDFRLINATGDMQIIPGGTIFNFVFSSPIVAAPALGGFGNITPTVAGASMSFPIPGSINMLPGAVLTFSGARLNLAAVPNGQDVTVQMTTTPSGAIHLQSNLVKLATTNSSLCSAPSFTAAGVVNAASFLPGISYGSIATLFGTHLSNSTGIVPATTVPLPRLLAGVTLSMNGILAPLVAVANVNGQEQINFQVPWELALLASPANPSIVVNNNGVASSPVPVNVLPISPGLFTVNTVFAAVLHSDSITPVTQANPAAPNEIVELFATGLGPVSPNPGTGNGALGDPLSFCSNVFSIRLAEVQIAPEFCGLAPGFVGLYQVNFRVPASATPGNYVVAISGGAILNQPILPIR